MSDAYTEIAAGGQYLGIWGHCDPDDATRRMREFYQRERANADRALAALDAGAVRVYHQYGNYAAKKRRLVHGVEE